MGCGCKDKLIGFDTQPYFSTVEEFTFFPVAPFQPGFGALRAVIRMLAEQGDGLIASVAVRTATVRYDVNGAAGLNAWVAVGTAVSNDGDSNPEDIDISSTTNGEFWVQPGVAVKKGGSASALGQAQVGVQLALPTERLVLEAGPVLLNTVRSPVGDRYAELWACEWMSFYDVQEIQVPYDVFDTADFRFKIVLQSVKSDPSQEAPSEDTILAATTGSASGVASASSFTNASTNKAQLCRVVFMADNNGAGSEGKGRAWLAVAVKWA